MKLFSLLLAFSFLVGCSGGANVERLPLPSIAAWSTEMLFTKTHRGGATPESFSKSYLSFDQSGNAQAMTITMDKEAGTHVYKVYLAGNACGTYRVIAPTTLGVDFGEGEFQVIIDTANSIATIDKVSYGYTSGTVKSDVRDTFYGFNSPISINHCW
ncbi:MAG: hypothetical protein J7501_09095 [Bdellovibrio sp.]|nr:hypothetical protein [Bdellovibrio sp.]